MMITKDEALGQYSKALAEIDFSHQRARDEARGVLNLQLKAIRDEIHKELKAARAISQKVR